MFTVPVRSAPAPVEPPANLHPETNHAAPSPPAHRPLTLTALTAPAHASGFNCPVTPPAPDCEPLIDTA
ncbi:MAG: hypothetical protein R3F65_27820 [bacterium]